MCTAAVFLGTEKAFNATWHLDMLYKLSELKFSISLIKLSRTIYSVLNATIFFINSPPYDMFRPPTTIIRCFVYAKTVALYTMYNMFTYFYTCKCDVSCFIYLMYTRYLFALIDLLTF
jgi:hypothetical protein